MIKRIIFDLDDTLIKWEKEYWSSLNSTLDDLGIKYDKHLIDNLIKAVDDYESIYNTYTKENMVSLMNKYTNLNLNNSFMDIWFKYLSLTIPSYQDKELINTLEYLYNKYELVILSNWFEEPQINRLKNMNIDKYFKEYYFSENNTNKPAEEAYLRALGDKKISECAIVGDSYKTDIEIPSILGMKAIQVNEKLESNETKYICINKFIKLKDVL